eukprot:TRINITY_DN3736_c0_g1_i4.p1 TRINITY_DN3736_c0_g1~~TRINITY_DN3736_c0_g1_i4.p1  ORF type:complete len:418 (-),score=57.96 TRINITY_DN3736_c0_g1_i4:133-1386(-)
MGGFGKIVANSKGLEKAQSESVLTFFFMIVTWLLGIVSGSIKILFSALEYPFIELLDYQQDHLERGVKEEADKSNSVKVLQHISSFLGSIEDESGKEAKSQLRGSEVHKQVSIPIKGDQSKNQHEQQQIGINSKQESEVSMSNKKQRKSRRKSKKRGEKALHLSAYSSSHANEKRIAEEKAQINLPNGATNEIVGNPSKNQSQFVMIDPPNSIQSQNFELGRSQLIDSPPESPVSMDFEDSVFDEAAERELFMKSCQYQYQSKPCQKIVTQLPQPVEQISQISCVNSQSNKSNESNVGLARIQNVVVQPEQYDMQSAFMSRAFSQPEKLPKVFEQPRYHVQEKFGSCSSGLLAQTADVRLRVSRSKSADLEMEDLLSHIEVVRMKSQVDPEAIDWYHRNIQILSSIDINSLVKKLHN